MTAAMTDPAMLPMSGNGKGPGGPCGPCGPCGQGVIRIEVYPRRWYMLALFTVAFIVNCYPWLQYTVIADVITLFYGVGNELVEWTVLVFNATAIVSAFPAAWVLDKYGARPILVWGSAFMAVGMWFKVLGCWPDCFWAALLGQAINALATHILMAAPGKIAAVWFPADEVSTALGISMMGQMLGVAIGCFASPLLGSATSAQEENFKGFIIINLTLAISATVLLVAIFFTFQEAPELPPTAAQAAAAETHASSKNNMVASMKRIFSIFSFWLLLISYTIVISVYIAVTTVLNREVILYFPDRAADAGYIATLLTLSGMISIMVISVFLDKTKRFKEATVGCCLFGFISCVAYSLVLSRCGIIVLYWVAAGFGVFMTSYFVPSFEYGMELTYPEPEGNPVAILNFAVQPFAMLITLTYSRMFDAWGPDWAHSFLCGLLAVGLCASLFIRKDYKRFQAGVTLGKHSVVEQAEQGEEAVEGFNPELQALKA